MSAELCAILLDSERSGVGALFFFQQAFVRAIFYDRRASRGGPTGDRGQQPVPRLQSGSRVVTFFRKLLGNSARSGYPSSKCLQDGL